MKELILVTNCTSLDTGVHPEVANWANIYELIGNNVTVIDRCNWLQTPFRFKSIFPMPTDLNNFNKSYADICLERAHALIAHSRAINKPIVILYSGGIDSTVVAISFIMAANGDHSNIKIALNVHSIRENPNFYYNHIRGNFELLPSESILNTITSDCILVGGEGNDQLFGTDIYKAFCGYDSISALHQDYNEANIVPFFISTGMTEKASRVWFSLMDEQIRATNLCEIKTIKEFFWWYNFCYKWQNVYLRIPARATTSSVMTPEFLNQYYFQFFMTDDFQRWSMLNSDKKIDQTWTSYKKAAKEFILSYTNDEEYFMYKTKVPSLVNLFRGKLAPEGFDSNYNIIYNLNPEDYYVADNHFQAFK